MFAKSGFDTVFVARSDEKVAPFERRSQKSLDRAVGTRQAHRGGRDAALARITGTADLEDLADVDLVVEAVVEEIGVKTALFSRLDEICKPGTVLATTTSSLPVVEMRR